MKPITARIIPILAHARQPNAARPHRFMPVSQQRSLAGFYPAWIKWLAWGAFAWAFAGWLNETWFYGYASPIWLNRYTEYALILIFGLWRIRAEKNPYTRKRLIWLVANVTVLWWLIPWLYPFIEPYVGYIAGLPAFPSLHTPGTLTFFLVLIAVFLFGRRVICGWNCPCVAIREVVGFPYRHADHVPRGDGAWRWRHLKWLWFALYLGAMWAVTRPANNTTSAYLGFFGLMIGLPYFISFLLAPWVGNRSYCRFLCPYGATFGLLNRVGLFRIDYQAESCIECGLCIKVCVMNIPVWEMGKQNHGQVDSTECMGCGRCVTECPTKSLAFHDARNLLLPSLHQDRDHLRQASDWRRPLVALKGVAYVTLLVGLLGAAAYTYSQVGTLAELPARMGALCGLPVLSW
ncbi:MAG: 4Fe-4S binding protein [Magnetococcales bacterium]|nr:4Fe-4S binding protein [Magnetococcales bacterium]